MNDGMLERLIAENDQACHCGVLSTYGVSGKCAFCQRSELFRAASEVVKAARLALANWHNNESDDRDYDQELSDALAAFDKINGGTP